MKKSQETGWLGNMLSWGQRRQMQRSETLYTNAVEMARNPLFYNKFDVKDDVDGRFDALALCVSLVMRRLKGLDEEGRELSQQLFDSMFADMDLSLREMWAGDLGVSKRVRVMAEAFMGRLDAYATAIDTDDRDALAAALERNLLRGTDSPDALASGLVDYVFGLVEALDKVAPEELLEGRLTLPVD